MPQFDPFRSLAGQPAKDSFAVQEQSFRGTHLVGALGQAWTLPQTVETRDGYFRTHLGRPSRHPASKRVGYRQY